MTIEGKKFHVVGTSGSPDYLNDTTDDRRLWLLSVPGEGCDGLHDEAAPVQYLCSKCFLDLRGDLAEPQDDDDRDEDRRDAHAETE